MNATEAPALPDFKGSTAEKDLAADVYKIFIGSARFFRDDSAITVALSALAEHFANRDSSKDSEQWAQAIEKALIANEHVFLREEREERVVFLTTRRGVPPVLDVAEDTTHSFARRFETPKPKPAQRAERRKPQRRDMDESGARTDSHDWSGFAEPQPSDAFSGDLDIASIVEEALAELDVPKPPTEPEERAEVVSDLSDVSDEQLRVALLEQLATDFSVAHFADTWMVEERVPRLSRGDLRRIRDYISERGEPVTDESIVQEVLGIRPNAQEYDLHRFSVNFRLSRESREFEFVGVSGYHAWTTSDVSLVPASKRRPAEIGQDYRVILLSEGDDHEAAEEGVVEHVLTYYEYVNGVLPYNSTVRALLGSAVMPGQRAALFRVESPQNHDSFWVELRFPTGNRGGYLFGFEQFFREQLVPGAFVSLERGEEPGILLIEYLPVSGQDRKLLKLDEKKNTFTFESKTFYCAPEEDMLLSENRFPRFEGQPPLEDRVRRRPEDVLAATFERIGEPEQSNGHTRFMAMADELFCASNVERPMPLELIRQITSSPDHPAFSVDPEADDVFYYEPAGDA